MYAIVHDSVVTNTIVWDGVAPWAAPADVTVVPVPYGIAVSIGWSYSNGEFAPKVAA